MDEHFIVMVRPLTKDGPWQSNVCGNDESKLLYLLMRDGTKVTDFTITTLHRGECPVCHKRRADP